MSTNHTPNFNLCQWEATDKVLRADFNEDNQKIDAALAGLQQSKGNCRIVTGNYTGTGTYSSVYPNSLSFNSLPLVLFVGGHQGLHFWAVRDDDAASATRGSNGPQWITLEWSENAVSWYNVNSAESQLNVKDRIYRYIALLAAE